MDRVYSTPDHLTNTSCGDDGAGAPFLDLGLEDEPDSFVPWAPHVLIWTFAPLLLASALTSLKSSKPTHAGKKMQMSGVAFLATVSLFQMSRSGGIQSFLTNPGDHHSFLPVARLCSTMISAALGRNSRSSWWLLIGFWGMLMTSDSINVYENLRTGSDLTTCVLPICCALGAFVQVIIIALTSSYTEPQEPQTRETCSLFGRLTNSWITPIIWRGYRNGLQESDVPNMAENDKCKTVSAGFRTAWLNQKESLSSTLTENKESSVNLLTVMIKQYGAEFSVYQLIKLFFELTEFFEPLLLGYLLNYLENRDTAPYWHGYVIVCGCFLSGMFRTFGHSIVWTYVDKQAKRMKMSFKMAVYRKALSAKNEGKRDLTAGEIVSLVSDDCEHLVNCSNLVFLLLATPIQVTLALYMLYQQLGVGAFIGLVIMLTLIPLNKLVGQKLKEFEKEKEEVKEKRIKMMNEVLNGIKVLKLYAWEKSFIKKITDIRDKETTLHKKIFVLHAGIDFMFGAVPFMVQVGGFMTFLYLGGYLDPSTAFMAASLFHILNRPFSLMAIIIPDFVRGASSLKKLNKFLNISDIPEDVVNASSDTNTAIKITNGSFTWDTSKSKTCIDNVNIDIQTGKLVAVVGMVGCGKSSLLSAVLGEMEKLKGDVTVTNSTAYVPQEAWILNCSLKENVTFGSAFSSDKYNRIVNACALKEDFKILTKGDKTLIGEKGVNLSGGQKQRVSLARSVYADAGIYLLDDPLSAVDAHVGKHIFDHVIGPNGLLKDKTRVMVTHGVHWLPKVDTILVMADGQIRESGTYKELISRDGAFAKFIRDVTSNNDPESENKDCDTNTKAESIAEEAVKETSSSKNQDTINESEEDDDEDEEKDTLDRGIYLDYLKPVGYKYLVACILIFVVHLVCDQVNEVALARWSDDKLLANLSLAHTDEYKTAATNHLITFVVSGSIKVIMSFLFICIVLIRGCEAAKHHHNALVVNILRSPMSFFDTTSTGKIINRFSKDIGSVDGLAGCLRGYIMSIGWLTCHVCMVIITTPYIIPYLIPIAMIFFGMNHVFMRNLKQLRRYRTRSRAPVFGHLNETLSGTDSVRAYGATGTFIEKMENKLENQMKFEMTEHWFHSWFRVRITFISSLVTLVSGFAILWDDDITPGMAGLVLNMSTHVVNCLGWVIGHASHTETELISLERVIEYSNRPTEASWETEGQSLSPQWPESGEIIMDDYQTRYRDGLDLVLRGVTCNIKSGEKVGIVGRTGAGKSSLTVGLFRLVEATSGKISLDGEHIEPLGLHDLRQKLTILPQDPVIFGGTLKMNLDPFGEKTKAELWEALKHSHLKTFVESLPDQLEHECGEGGKNLSMGQRQLVCLARTLLRRSPVLVLDEATAGVDMETDELIQATIRAEFKDCTVLTIAHRLNTIMDYDRVMVLDHGKIAELDSPKNLLADHSSAFYSMAKDANLV